MRKKTVMRLAAIVATVASIMFGLVPATFAGYTEPSFHNDAFRVTWEQDDLEVLNGADKSWTWGPAYEPAAGITTEPYKEAPNGTRTVQYFDKSRMEDNSYRASGQWGVTNGLLVVEMVSGMMQLGDDTFFDCGPAEIPVAGDRVPSNLLTYARFHDVLNHGGEQWFADYFGEFMARDNATYKVGLASSPAWWTDAPVGGQMRHILVQLGERRALTYTEGNPDGWKAEWGNVGQHYYEWRYGPGGCEDKLRAQNGGGDNGGDTGNDDSGRPDWLGSQCELAPNLNTVSGSMSALYKAPDALAYPDMKPVDPNRSGELFPDTDIYGESPRVGYEQSWENNDYFEDCFGDTDVPQYWWRVVTTGYFWIPASGKVAQDVSCIATERKGCMLLYINHYGTTAKFNGVYSDNGFTVAGETWNLDTPDKVTKTAQVLTDHFVYRMLYGENGGVRNDGTNCGYVDGCNSVEWHVVILGNGKMIEHWAGIYPTN